MTLEPQFKLAVLEDNRFLFGDAEMRLLEEIGRGGTLTEAAATLGLSYRVAWGKLRDLEAAVGTRLVERTAGGRSGGSSRLTAAAVQLVERYRQFREAVGAYALVEFERCFAEAPRSLVFESQLAPGSFADAQRPILGPPATKLEVETP